MHDLLLALAIAVVACDPPREGLQESAIRITSDENVIADVWPSAKPVRRDGAAEPRANYSSIARGELLAVVRFKAEWTDYRGQRVPPGVYEMRYGVQPLLKDHAGTSRWRDFALLSGEGEAPSHPFVMALVPVEDADAVIEAGGIRIGLELDDVGQLSF